MNSKKRKPRAWLFWRYSSRDGTLTTSVMIVEKTLLWHKDKPFTCGMQIISAVSCVLKQSGYLIDWRTWSWMTQQGLNVLCRRTQSDTHLSQGYQTGVCRWKWVQSLSVTLSPLNAPLLETHIWRPCDRWAVPTSSHPPWHLFSATFLTLSTHTTRISSKFHDAWILVSEMGGHRIGETHPLRL